MIKLGQKVEDKITGFKGTVTGITEYITGCTTVLVQPRVKEDGTAIDGRWYDEPRLEVLDEESIMENETPDSGADIAAPVK